MFGYIYITTNLVNGKRYIGKHKSSSFQPDKYIGSGKLLKQSIQKYGRENFICEMLCACGSVEELNAMEKFWIERYNASNVSDFYNISLGGDGGNTTGGRIKITNGISERSIDPQDEIPDGWWVGAITTGDKNWNFGKSFVWINDGNSEYRIESSATIPEGFQVGRLLKLSSESKLQIGKHHNTYRENFSEEFLTQLSENWVGENNPSVKDPKYGRRNPFYGKHHSQETIEKNRLAHLERVKCPFCDYVSNKGSVTKHIRKIHTLN